LPVALARVAGDALILVLVLTFVHGAGDLRTVPSPSSPANSSSCCSGTCSW
jgi:hypothetical protein